MKFGIGNWLTRFGWTGWSGWPDLAYRRPTYGERLQAVQEQFTGCLERVASGPVRVLSICAGDGRDVIGVLRSHPRRADVEAHLLELNARSVAEGMQRACASGLENTVKFVCADATDYSSYGNLVPCHIVLLCGVWGHVPVEDQARLVGALASFCHPGGYVIWTRKIAKGGHHLEDVRSKFADTAWTPVWQSVTADGIWAVHTYAYHGPALAIPAHGRIFSFREKSGKRRRSG